MSIQEIQSKIQEYSKKLEESNDLSQRVKKRIFQKLGKLKKDLIETQDTIKSQSEIRFKRKDSPMRNGNESIHDKLEKGDNDAFNDEEDDDSQPEMKKPKIDIGKKQMKAKLHLLNKELAELATKKLLNKAKKLVRQHKAKGFKLDLHTYTNLINAHVRCNDIKGAEDQFQELIANGITPNIVTFTTLLKGYCEMGKMKDAERLFTGEMFEKKLWNLRSLSTYLRGCNRVNWHKHGLHAFKLSYSDISSSEENIIFEEAQESSCYESMVGLLCRGGQLKEAIDIVSQLVSQSSSTNMLENAGLYTILARTLTIFGIFPEAKKYLHLANELIGSEENSNLKENIKKKLLASSFSNQEDKKLHTSDSKSRIKSVELFQSHKRKELKNELESLQDYIGSTESIFKQKRASNPSQLDINQFIQHSVKESCKLYLELISSLLIPGFDGQGDLEVTDSSRSNLPNDYLITALSEKFGYYASLIKSILLENNKYLKDIDAESVESDLRVTLGILNKRIRKIIGGKSNQNWNLRKMFQNFTEKDEDEDEILDVDAAQVLDDIQKAQMKAKEDADVPIKLEIGSGNGDWIVAQAAADNIISHNGAASLKGYWIGMELRADRCYNILTRHLLNQQRLRERMLRIYEPNELIVPKINNLAVIGGDAHNIIENYISNEVISSIFINYPQPPERVSGGGGPGEENTNQGAHLLTYDFFLQMLRILKINGTLTILSDNLPYTQSLARTIAYINKHNSNIGLFSLELDESERDNRMVEERINFSNSKKSNLVPVANGRLDEVLNMQEVVIYRGDPGSEGGHVASTSSYFDRLWALGQKKRRWFLYVKKIELVRNK